MQNIIASLTTIIDKKFGNDSFIVIVTKAGNYFELAQYHNEDFEALCYTVNDRIGVGIESFDRDDIVTYVNDMENQK